MTMQLPANRQRLAGDTVMNRRGLAKTYPALNARIPPELKAIVDRTAEALHCSQAVALAMILERIPTTADGLPVWVEQMVEEDAETARRATPLFKTA